MKFFTPAFLTLIAVASAAAQRASFGFPLNGTDIPADQEFVLQIARPNFISSAIEVGIVIGVASCEQATCIAPADGGMGTILYNGPFSPEYDEAAPSLPPHQNFTGHLPEDIAKGPAQLSLTQFSLIGASEVPSTFYDVIFVNIV
ncbi:hypothetical protein L218DRAFT_1004097 [Marasmius fiardii PR-910]|nr:hypothetical protein L218DRAFT_1004097 [Marasmius fiardii PR-910]